MVQFSLKATQNRGASGNLLERSLGLFALLLGAIFALSFSQTDYQPLALVVLTLFFIGWALEPRARGAHLYSFLFGLGLYSVGLFWVVHSMTVYGGLAYPLALLGLLAMALVLSLFPLLASVLARFLGREALGPRLMIFASMLVFLDWLRDNEVLRFGWLAYGYSVTDTPLINLAHFGGVTLMSWMLLVGAAALAYFLIRLFSKRFSKLTMPSIVLWIAIVAGATWWVQEPTSIHPVAKPTPADDAPLWVRAIEPGLPVISMFYHPSDSERLASLLPYAKAPWPSEAMAGDRLWIAPEGLIGNLVNTFMHEQITLLNELQSAAKSPVLISGFLAEKMVPSAEDPTRLEPVSHPNPTSPIYNGTFMWDRGFRYTMNKREMVPFGEYVPRGFRWFVDWLGIPMHDLMPGSDDQSLLTIHGKTLGLLICYENLFGERIRVWWTREGATPPDALVLSSNLSWFGPFIREQQLQMARVRAVEVNRPVLSVSNDGPSAWISARGVVEKALPMGETGVMTAPVYASKAPPTFFVQAGEWMSVLWTLIWALLAFVVGLFGSGARRREFRYRE